MWSAGWSHEGPPPTNEMITIWTTSAANTKGTARSSISARRESRPPVSGTAASDNSTKMTRNIRGL